jgi:hypothetical protein
MNWIIPIFNDHPFIWLWPFTRFKGDLLGFVPINSVRKGSRHLTAIRFLIFMVIGLSVCKGLIPMSIGTGQLVGLIGGIYLFGSLHGLFYVEYTVRKLKNRIPIEELPRLTVAEAADKYYEQPRPDYKGLWLNINQSFLFGGLVWCLVAFWL